MKFPLKLPFLLWGALFGAPVLAQNAVMPAATVGDEKPASWGGGIERTLELLRSSTPANPNTVRILFYGQSSVESPWSAAVADDLRRRFPSVNFIMENRALGGYTSDRLEKTAEADVYPFAPDLMIFHVYGSPVPYENLIRRTRERTGAEVLLLTDYVRTPNWETEPTDAAQIKPDGKIWTSFMNFKFLPELAAKYGCGLVDVRGQWKAHLRATGDNFLSYVNSETDTHLNARGNALMAGLVSAYLVPRPNAPRDVRKTQSVKTLVVGQHIFWKNGVLRVPFEGNRVVAVGGETGKGTAKILVDNRAPSEWSESYFHTRALALVGGKWPVIARIGFQSRPVREGWILTATRDAQNPKIWRFSLAGSQTGPDGEGSSDARFVSRSGRVVIEKEDWDVDYALSLPKIAAPSQLTVQWRSEMVGADEWVAAVDEQNIVQNLPAGPHILELRGQNVKLHALRIYQPPVF